MQMHHRMPATVAVVLLAFGLTACSAQTGAAPSRSPSVSAHTPLFTSDDAALKAATDAYAAYLEMSDTIGHDGGVGVKRIDGTVTSAQLKQEESSFQKLAHAGKRTNGDSKFDTVRLARYDRGTGEVELYLCVDVSGIRVTDSNGTDVTPAGRPARTPMDVTFERRGTKLLIASSDVWSGANFC